MSRRIPFGAPILTTAGMRAAEQVAIDGGVSVDELMERAGLAVAREVRCLAAGRPILVAAGPGNNGGDAYVAARHLADWGLDVVLAAHGRPRDGAAARMAARWRGDTMPFDQAAPRPILVDGLFGTGLARPLADEVAQVLDTMRGGADLTLAIDLPSGVEADDRSPHAGRRADVTIALGALKPVHVVGPNAANCGHVILADIGLSIAADWRTIDPPRLARLRDDAQKFSRGMVAVVGGAMPGASLLAATAAMHGGAGYVLLLEEHSTGTSPHALVRRVIDDPAGLDAALTDERIGAVVIGPGLGRDEPAGALLDRVLASPRDLVIDADVLSMLGSGVAARIDARRRTVFLTPHGGEFDRMFGIGNGNKIERTLAAARTTGATIVHKGADTVIASPEGKVVVAAGSTPWLSTAGTGDVLAGLLASRWACDRHDPLTTASEAVWLHAAAAGSLTPPFIADDLVDRLPDAIAASSWG